VASAVANPAKEKVPQESSDNDQGRFLTTAQLAQRWNFHVGSILRWCRQGRLPTVRVGRRVLVQVAAIVEYEADATVGQWSTQTRRSDWRWPPQKTLAARAADFFGMPNRGFIYVLVNAAMPKLLKIGKTTRSPSDWWSAQLANKTIK